MTITAVKQQSKRTDRYSIFVEGKYAFSLSAGALLGSGLASGQQLDATKLQAYKEQSNDDKLYGRALRYAAMRLRSEWELRTYLGRKQCPPALVNIIVNKLSDIDLLNDEKYASTWVETRRLLRPTSKRKLQQELRAKHINDEIIRSTLGASELDDQAMLKDLISKKRRQSTYATDHLKLMRYLARQGFSYDDIKSALSADNPSD